MSLTMDGRTIRVVKPDVPAFSTPKPAPSRLVVVVARGPKGEQGDPGTSGDIVGGSA